MAEHARFSVATGVPVYFCDPHSPWQRGSNENTNGLLRQYFPRSTDFRAVTQSDLDAVAAELNDRPRQTLKWKSPCQVLDQACDDRLRLRPDMGGNVAAQCGCLCCGRTGCYVSALTRRFGVAVGSRVRNPCATEADLPQLRQALAGYLSCAGCGWLVGRGEPVPGSGWPARG
jgi:hypothetical protein